MQAFGSNEQVTMTLCWLDLLDSKCYHCWYHSPWCSLQNPPRQKKTITQVVHNVQERRCWWQKHWPMRPASTKPIQKGGGYTTMVTSCFFVPMMIAPTTAISYEMDKIIMMSVLRKGCDSFLLRCSRCSVCTTGKEDLSSRVLQIYNSIVTLWTPAISLVATWLVGGFGLMTTYW